MMRYSVPPALAAMLSRFARPEDKQPDEIKVIRKGPASAGRPVKLSNPPLRRQIRRADRASNM